MMKWLCCFFAGISLFSISLFAEQLPQSSEQQDEWQTDEWDAWDETEEEASAFSGFVELGTGWRLKEDNARSGRATLQDARVQLQWDKALEASSLKFTSDLYYDGVKDNIEFQIREAVWQGKLSALGAWGDNFDLKIGQQVLTWGTGDYLFLNDLFPKDYQSFFAGRDDDYLKAPSLSAKLSGYFDWANVDLVVTPRFAPDTYINGEYFSFFNPQAGWNVAPEFTVADENRPDNPEWAMRIYRSLGTTDLAFYGYRGFHKSPSSADTLGRPLFSRLNVYGASIISPFASGLVKGEFAYYDSKDDSDGTNPLIVNSQSRFLVGYEQELIANLTGSVQWYLERSLQHDELIANSPWPQFEQEQNRHVITTQLIYRAMRQTLTLNWFNFYSPTDDDGYMKFRVSYSPVDDWSVAAGANLFYGDKPHTFFNQFEDASNVYASFRYYY